MIHAKYFEEIKKQEELLSRKNRVDVNFYNGIFDRYENPVLTREHAPVIWRYDIDEETNLAAMDWQDFEHLIRELFEKE